MADLLKDIGDYLIAAGIAVADGTDLFRDKVPDSPDAVIVLSEYGGSPMSLYIEAMDRSVQVIVRATTYVAAKRTSWLAFNAIVNPDQSTVDFTTSRWGIVHARHNPMKMGEDKHSRISFVFNLGITTQGD